MTYDFSDLSKSVKERIAGLKTPEQMLLHLKGATNVHAIGLISERLLLAATPYFLSSDKPDFTKSTMHSIISELEAIRKHIPAGEETLHARLKIEEAHSTFLALREKISHHE